MVQIKSILFVYILLFHVIFGSTIEENENDQEEVQNELQKIKDKILKGLGMDSIPTETLPRDQIPNALLADVFTEKDIKQNQGNDTDLNFENEEESTEKKTMIIGKTHSLKRCGFHQCLKVSFDHELDPTDLGVLSAELWVYREAIDKEKPSRLSINTWKKKLKIKSKIHVSQVNQPNEGDGWYATQLKISQVIKPSTKNFNDKSIDLDLTFKLDIRCKCENCQFSMTKNHTPFISLTIVNRKKKITRRSALSEKCLPSGCCRKKLMVDFKAIGWDEWVFYPEKFNAYYCKGNCSDAKEHFYKHTSILKAVAKIKDHKADIKFCCTPRKFSSLNMIYMHKGSIIRRAISNIVAESCWCL